MMTKGAKRVADILCRRDDISLAEAKERISNAILRMADCQYDPIECEEIMMDELGLEMDYIFDLL